MGRRSLQGLLITVLIVAACRPSIGDDRLIIATPAAPETLVPPMVTSDAAAALVNLLFDRLAYLGPAGETIADHGFTPGLAARWHWASDSAAVIFELDPRARWHDGQPVTPRDVVYAWHVLRDSATMAPRVADLNALVDSVSAGPGASAATVWFKSRRPDRFYWVTETLIPLPEHVFSSVRGMAWSSDTLVRMPIGSGPYQIEEVQAARRYVLRAVPGHYRAPAQIRHVIVQVFSDPQSAYQAVTTGAADFIESATRAQLQELEPTATVRALELPAFDYTFAVFNTQRPLLRDAALRRALVQATNRDVVRRSVFDTLAFTLQAPVVRAQFTYDSTLHPLDVDTAAAAATLDSLGWRRGPDGVRQRGGHRLAVEFVVPSSSKSRIAAAMIIQAQWRELGIAATITSLEFQTAIQRLMKRDYDVFFSGWQTGPAPAAIRTTWGPDGLVPGGHNLAGYAAPEVRAALDSADRSPDRARVRTLYARVYQQIVDDALALWLFEPRPRALIQRRVTTPPTLQSVGWALTLPAWTLRHR